MGALLETSKNAGFPAIFCKIRESRITPMCSDNFPNLHQLAPNSLILCMRQCNAVKSEFVDDSAFVVRSPVYVPFGGGDAGVAGEGLHHP